MNFKLTRFLLMVLVLLQMDLHRPVAAEIEAGVMIKNAIMDADEVRILHLISESRETLMGYRSMTPQGRRLLAEIFAKADFRGLGNPDGTQDPTGGAGFNTNRGMIVNVYKNKRLTHELIINAGDYIHLVVPKDAWYETSFESIAKENSPVDVNAPSIEDIILRDVKKLSSTGDWEEALSWTGDRDELYARTEEFMPGIVKPGAPKPASEK